MAAPEEAHEPLQYQTLALRVSLHCEGCKKEVKRVLHHIEGVYKVSFDSQQHKVVVTGNVQADTLIKKLNKFGKHAELWPEPKLPENAAAAGDGSSGGGGGGGKKKGKGKNRNKNKNKSDGRKGDEQPENAENNPGDDGPAEAPDKLPDAEVAPPAAEKQSGAEKPAANAPGGGGGGGKRKGKKGHKDPNSNSVGVGGGNPGEAPPQEASKKAEALVGGGAPLSLPPPAAGFPAQLPTYVVSYSAVQPSMSQGGAYHHHHQHHPMATQHSSYVYSTASPGSYYIFSEENANACSVM